MNKGFNVQTPQSDEWETPGWLFRALNTEFGFTLDPCATKENAKCKLSINRESDGASYRISSWRNSRVFVNPPYSDINRWVDRAIYATKHEDALVVMLLPVRADSDWFQKLIEYDMRMRFFRKRIAFLENGVEQKSPRFASMVVILR